MKSGSFVRVTSAIATAVVTALFVVVPTGPSQAATTTIHILNASAGTCLVPRVRAVVSPVLWVLDEPYAHATQAWLLDDARLDVRMTRVPCTTSHALEVYAVKQLWTSAAQIPAPGTAAEVRLWRDRIVPFCTARARAFLGLPTTAKPVFTAVWPSRAQSRALGSLGVRCLLLNQLQSSGTSIALGTMGNKSWKASGDRYFNATPVPPRVASSVVTCAVVPDGIEVTRRLRIATDLRWIIPANLRFSGTSFLGPNPLVSPAGVGSSYAYPVQNPSSTSVVVDESWTVPAGTVEVSLPGTTLTHWVSPVGARYAYRLTTPSSTVPTAGCTV